MSSKTKTPEALEFETPEDWRAQTPCPECGGRPGRSPEGFHLRIKLPNGEWEEGHTYNCQKRRQE